MADAKDVRQLLLKTTRFSPNTEQAELHSNSMVIFVGVEMVRPTGPTGGRPGVSHRRSVVSFE